MVLRRLTRIHWLLPAIGLLVALAFVTRRHVGGPGGGAPVDPGDAGDLIGREATVCGVVREASRPGHVGGDPVFLNFGAPHPNQSFTAVIWGRHRDGFAAPPRELYDGEKLCVAGEIRDHRGTPQIEIRGPEQVRLGPPPR